MQSMKILVGLMALTVTSSVTGKPPQTKNAKPTKRPRVREAGINIGILPTGKHNAITDVAGVRVGHRTLVEGPGTRTGVTAILAHGGNLFQEKVPAAIVVSNGFGKFLGSTQVNELGRLETPIALTNTLSSFTVANGLLSYTLKQKGNENLRSVNPVVGECNDAYLNDIRARRVRERDVFQAIEVARSGPVAEGSVGAGTGTRCMGWKGGIGTASRKLPRSRGGYTLGVLVQTNFNGVLNVAGAPVGRKLGRYYLKREVEPRPAVQGKETKKSRDREDGSCIVVVATDAPLNARQLKRLARRALLGLAEIGSPMTHGSGDYAIAFSTATSVRSAYLSNSATESRTVLRDDRLSPLFLAAKEATAESVLNSLFQATTVVGHRGRRVQAIPIQRVLEICRQHRVIASGKSATQPRE